MFDKSSVDFLADLAEHNDRDWFIAHKEAYETAVKRPGDAFADAFAARLSERLGRPLRPKIFRIHRDVRFSKDKRPYKAHFHMLARVEGEDEPVFMFGLEPGRLRLGMGVFSFSRAGLTRWREAAAGPAGGAFLQVLNDLEKAGRRLSAPELRRTPAPYDADHPHAALLRRKGVTVWIDDADLDLAFGAKGPSHCAGRTAALDEAYSRLQAMLAADD